MHEKVTPRLGRPGVRAACHTRCGEKSQFEMRRESVTKGNTQ